MKPMKKSFCNYTKVMLQLKEIKNELPATYPQDLGHSTATYAYT